ncbi:hypothetical protein [Streptomyces sp. NPDC056144]|uniref:hypothetical protein n=1 Tax=unclassified Streptomyces TaxID=2593676 RepID=UPI0035DBB2A9
MRTETKAGPLLLWLHSKAHGIIGRDFDLSSDPDGIGYRGEELLSLVEWLEKNGFVVRYEESDVRTAAALTARGVSRAEELIREKSSPTGRFHAALNALVTAAMDSFPEWLSLSDFLQSPRALVPDHRLTAEEVSTAVDFLVAARLADLSDDAEKSRLKLTPHGIRCGGRSPVDVRTFVDVTPPPAQTITVNGPAQIGNNNTQNNTFGFGPSNYAQFARDLLAAVAAADITDAERALVTGRAQELQGELASASPEPGAMRRFFENTRQAAYVILPEVAVQAMLAAAGLPFA